MIRKPIVFPGNAPLTRALAAEVVQTASGYDARVMIQREQKIVNAKSMLGLLSLGIGGEDLMLVVDGPQEAEAAEAIQALMKELFGV
jgi:phosphotransferase system HPr (HPr) family protein